MRIDFKAFQKTCHLFISKETLANPKHKLCFTIAILLIGIDIAATTLMPYYSKKVVDTLSLDLTQSIGMLVFLLGFFWTLGKTVNHWQEIVFFPIINRTIRDLMFKVVNHIHSIPLFDYQKLSIPEVINCMRRISLSARAFIKIVFLMIIPAVFKLIIASTMIIHAGLFGLWLLPTLGLSILMLYQGTRWYAKAREAAWVFTDTVTTRINDSIINTKTIRLFQDHEMEKIKNLLATEATLWQKTNTRLHFIYIFIGTLLGITITGILMFTVYAIQQKTLSIGDFVLLQGQLIAIFLPLKNFSTEFRQLAESLVDIKKIIQLLEIPIETPIEKNKFSDASLSTLSRPYLAIKNISFSHDLKKPLFQDLSLSIEKNSKIGLTGESGCGKSSLLNLIASLYKPTDGKIFIDNRALQDIPSKELKHIIHLIPQDFRLFNLSLRENITYGCEAISESAIDDVLEKLNLLPLVQQTKNGLDSIVGEMGIRLSGGEKQKVALARALLLAPQILLLDETTNSLNTEIEAAILDILFKQIPTVILVSHRATTIQGLDQIYTLQDGEISVMLKHPTIEKNARIYEVYA